MTTVSTLPTAPNRNDPSTFAPRADAWVAAIGTWTTEVNTVAGEINTNATNAGTAASTATTQADIATTKAAEAAASAATAVNAPGTSATSTTSNTIGTGSKTFTIQTGKAFVVGQWVTIADTAAPSTNYMLGAITVHNSGTGSITVNVESFAGSGSIASWSIGLSAVGGVSLDSAQTLTNKTIPYASNTLTGVQPTLVSGTNIKTINGTSVLGSGDVTVTSALVKIADITANNNATVGFVSSITSSYDEYVIHATDVIPVTDATNLFLEVSTDFGSTWLAGTNYAYVREEASDSDTALTVSSSTGTSFLQINNRDNLGSDVSEPGISLVLRLFNPLSTNHKHADIRCVYKASTLGTVLGNIGLRIANTSPVNAIRFRMQSGNIESGRFTIFGVNKV